MALAAGSGQRSGATLTITGQIPPAPHATLRSWVFWNLTGGMALRLIAKMGATVHIIPIMASQGVSAQTAAFLFGLQLFLTVPLYLVLGWAADRFPKPPVLM